MSVDNTALQKGISAIKTGENELAREQLILAISQNPENAVPWLWLGVVAVNLDERIQYLEQALSLDPHNQRTSQLLQTLRNQQIEEWIKEGISAVQDGDILWGEQLLTKAVTADTSKLEAWWWLGQASEAPEDKAICYENVLNLDPEHAGAELALEALKQIEDEITLDEFQSDETPLFQPADTTAEIDSDLHDLSSPSESHLSQEDLLATLLACPYCAEKTSENDKKCPNCTNNLYINHHSVSRPKPLYKILLAMEGGIFISAFLIPLLMLSFIDMFIDSGYGLDILRSYFAVNQPPVDGNIGIAFSLIPQSLFFVALIPSCIALFVFICILTRRQIQYFVALGLGSIRIVICFFIIFKFFNITAPGNPVISAAASHTYLFTPIRYSLIGAHVVVGLLSINSLFILMTLHDHFLIERTRRYLQIDRDIAGNDAGLRYRARVYAKERAWALSALHARESLVVKQKEEGYTLLATAYFNLGWHNKVTATLDQALALTPENDQLIELRSVLENQMNQNATLSLAEGN